MIFNNLRLHDPLLELELFLWQIVGLVLPNNFALSIGGNDLKVALCHIDFFLVEHSLALQSEI